jgi:Fic family protein
MRTPEPPPPLPANSQVSDAFATLVAPGATLLSVANEKYYPWEKFKHQTFPKNVSPQAAWAVLEAIRRHNSRQVPLTTKEGSRFRFWLDDHLLSQVLSIEGTARDPLQLLEHASAGSIRQGYMLNALMEEGIHSSILEGAATTRQEAKKMLRDGRPPRNKSEQMVVNNFQTMRQLQAWAKEPLSVERIRQIHASITNDTLANPNDAGRLQTEGEQRVRIVGVPDGRVVHSPPPASELPARLRALCKFANNDGAFPPAVVRAAILHFQIGYDHPFVDGNGRTARALFYWCMLRRGYNLFSYLTISKAFVGAPARYARSYLHTEQTTDLNYFIRFHMHAVDEALGGLSDYLIKKRSELQEANQRLRNWPGLSLRQQLLLEDALRQPAASYSATQVMMRFDIRRPTALKDLRGLVKAGLFVQRKSGKEFIFLPGEDLQQKLVAETR